MLFLQCSLLSRLLGYGNRSGQANHLIANWDQKKIDGNDRYWSNLTTFKDTLNLFLKSIIYMPNSALDAKDKWTRALCSPKGPRDEIGVAGASILL